MTPHVRPRSLEIVGRQGARVLFARQDPALAVPQRALELQDIPAALGEIVGRLHKRRPGVGEGALEQAVGAVAGPAVAVPSCSTSGTAYETAVAGCDQNTVYECGQAVAVNTLDLNENPGGASGDTATGLACRLTNSATLPINGQDQLVSTAYPFVAIAGSANPLSISGSPIVNSN